ncbi:hypothetical protein ACHAW5_004331 [Stephanodiscus triporus]|uniref:Helicase-associated domain-containing protein n=1 Tax=Stephanodiscus triporus TaxID=2934178 RepID=A0ABD3N353_9STRA
MSSRARIGIPPNRRRRRRLPPPSSSAVLLPAAPAHPAATSASGAIEPRETADLGAIGRLLSDAESARLRARSDLAVAESALRAAGDRHAEAVAAHDDAVAAVEDLRSRYRRRMSDDALRRNCRWNDMYRRLLEWREAHDGDTTVPCDADSGPEVVRLNRWVINQRTSYKYYLNGDKKHIKEHRIDALDKVRRRRRRRRRMPAIGFVWSVADQSWDKNFEELRNHYAKHETYHVAHKQSRKLAQFVSRLRTAMNHKNQGLVQTELTDERIRRLNSINFTWGIKRKVRKNANNETVKFDVMYEHLASFRETYGHTMVNKMEKEWKRGTSAPAQKVFRRLPLFLAFVRKEQLLYAEGRPCSLDEEKVRKLTELGVEWRRPVSEPRKGTGGVASRKKRRTTDLPHGQLLEEQQQYTCEGIEDEVDDVEEHHDLHEDISVHSPSGMQMQASSNHDGQQYT